MLAGAGFYAQKMVAKRQTCVRVSGSGPIASISVLAGVLGVATALWPLSRVEPGPSFSTFKNFESARHLR